MKETNLTPIIAASSVGTLIEWYDFYIFGSLASVISTKFFPASNPSLALISTLATFAAGFVVRPFGALFFGRLGDIIGRKYTFMMTLLLMGFSTFLIGLVPGYETIGVLAPLSVLVLRLLQGLALGGEYGGAATYVAEHSPKERRGFWTSWIQTTATVGLLVSLVVISVVRNSMDTESFGNWGWRIPFIASIFVVVISYFIRRGMSESPIFAKAKSEGKTSTNPLKESFGNKLNFKYVLLALLGATMGQGLVWYTGQFYAMSFMKTTLNVADSQAESIMIWAIVMATPLFVFFGWLSDKVGRKWIILAGMLLAVITYRPIFDKMFHIANLDEKRELLEKRMITVEAAPIKAANYAQDSIITTKIDKVFTDGTTYCEKVIQTKLATKNVLPPKDKIVKTKTLNTPDYFCLVGLVFLMISYVTMAYGPIAAFLVELFPVRIRYTSMSLPYHIGNGIFGGLVPAISTGLVIGAQVANEAAQKKGLPLPYSKPYLEGLWYPVVIIGISFVIGAIYLSNRKGIKHD